jgi:pilus assembly protein FimV
MMSRKLLFLGLIALILAPGAALSLGLGEIRLNSYLNQPMNAEIALSLSSRAELDTLSVELASLESFQRYGLDRPAYFDDLRFQVRPTGPASAVVQVTSTRPMVEPFLTFLVEARWSGGRILREYTVLLDPPVFLPTPEPEVAPALAPAPAPVVERPSSAVDPAPVGRPAPVPAPVAPPPREFGAEYGPVQRNETLWNIAQRVRPEDGLTTNQVMIALFRANPGAFDGNINRLRAGAILRVPSREQMAATSAGEANAEVSSQNQAWRGAPPVVAPADRRLELAPPTEAPRVPGADPTVATAPSRELMDAVQELRGELAETRRLVELRDAEIAALQARLAELEADSAAAAPVTPEATEPAAAEAAPAPAPAPAPAVETRAPAPPPPPPPPSLLDRALGLLGSLWLWLALAAALVAGAVIAFLRKRSEIDESVEKDLAETGNWGVLDTPQAKAAAAAAGAAGAQRAQPTGEILVEESPAAARPEAAPRAASEPVAARPVPLPSDQPGENIEEEYRYPFEDTIAGEAGINLDQSDPMAEADFHMAYGLYDQAAEIIKKAVEREPDRYDLRRKLLDICFVWGNAGEFLAQARGIREMPGELSGGDWAKVAIMGRQICPGEPLFEGGEPEASVDLDFSTDEPGEAPAGAADTAASGSWLDFDVGEAEPAVEVLGDTREHPAPGLSNIPLIEQTSELDLEELGIDLDLGETGEHALKDLAESAPELDDLVPPSFAQAPEKVDEPAEGAGDEEDTGGTQVMAALQLLQNREDPTQREEGFEMGEDDPTLSGLVEFELEGDLDSVDPSEDTLIREARAAQASDAEPAEDDADPTIVKQFQLPDETPTAEVDVLEVEEFDLNLDDLTRMLESPEDARAAKLDDATRLGTVIEESAFTEQYGDEDATRRVAVGDMTEVGTKLDLARAYIDMGDPEGARSILEEVLQEGNEAQQEEARQLMGSLG